jgi:V-type H+-transporting ATPase subunit C
MSSPIKYMLVSLPTSISPINDKEEALTALQSTVASDNVTVLPFKIPEFKIGTLDALVQQADDLAKLESSCETVVAKVGDSLRSLLEGDEEKISQQKTVNDSKFHGCCSYTRFLNYLRLTYLSRARRPISPNIHLEQGQISCGQTACRIDRFPAKGWYCSR